MPCNMLAVQAAKLTISPKLMRAIIANPLALELLKEVLSMLANQEITLIANASLAYIDLVGKTIGLRVSADGSVKTRDSWRVGYQHPNANVILTEFVNILQTNVAPLVVQQMVANALSAAGIQIEADTRIPTARVLTLNL